MKSHIVIHHSLTDDGYSVSWNAIREYHKKVNGWSDIGYNLGIELIGNAYEVLLGRMPDATGAHCRELKMNQYGIGICCVGNFDIAPPSEAMLAKLRDVCRWLMTDYKITAWNVIGHCEAQIMDPAVGRALKSCPGKRFDLAKFRSSL